VLASENPPFADLAFKTYVTTPPQPGITIVKVTTNDDTTKVFHFTESFAGQVSSFDLRGGESLPPVGISYDWQPGVHTFLEDVPPGWVLEVSCGAEGSTFNYIPGGVQITFVEGGAVECKFINSPAPPVGGVAVGGVVLPANTFALVAPWLAVIGLVGCIGIAAMIVKRRRS